MALQLPLHRFFAAFRAWSKVTRPSCARSRRPIRRSCLTATFPTCRTYSAVAVSSSSDATPEQPSAKPTAVTAEHVSASDSIGESGDLAMDMKMLMRNLRYTVVIVTACNDADWPFQQESSLSHPYLSPFYKNFCGATVSSYNLVTLGPPPMVSFNLRIPSRTLSGILKHKQFRIHALRSTVSGAGLANSFVRGDHESAFAHAAATDHWVGLDNVRPLAERTSLGDSAPFIHGVGIRAVISCRALPEKFVEVGDHVIVVGEVTRVRPVGSVTSKSEDNRRPSEELPFGGALTYYAQRYAHGARGTVLHVVPPRPKGPMPPSSGLEHSDITGVNEWIDQPLRTWGGKIIPFDKMRYPVRFITQLADRRVAFKK